MKAVELELTLIDFESTGRVGSYPDEPWQIGLARFAGGRVDGRRRYDSLLRIGDRPFSPYAPGRHEAHRAGLADAPSLRELWPSLRGWLEGRVLCGHNVSTEQRFLREAFPLQPMGPWVDTLRLARLAYPTAPSHKLEDLVRMLGLADSLAVLAPDRAPHDALYDALACGVLLEHLLGLPAWKDLPAETIFRFSRKKDV